MVLILGGAHDIVATTAVDLKKALRHSLLLLESAHAFFFHGLLLILTRVASRRLYEVMLLQMLSAFRAMGAVRIVGEPDAPQIGAEN